MPVVCGQPECALGGAPTAMANAGGTRRATGIGGRRMHPGRVNALLAILVSAGAASAALPPGKPTCKLFLNVLVGEGDTWGESFADNLREGLLKSRLVTLTPNAEDAGLEVLLVTVRNGPNSTAVTRLVTLVIRTQLPAEVPSDKGEVKISPRVMLAVARGPRIAIYKKANMTEGVAREVNILTNDRMLAACQKLSNKTFPVPKPPS